MSVEDDVDSVETELKELVTQTLEENGLLAKIRAQLRAGLYVALDNEINTSNKQCHIENSLKTNLAKADVRTVFCLVREFLDYYNLEFTNSVFEKETYLGLLYEYKGRDGLIKDLEISGDTVSKAPLLVEILKSARNSCKNSTRVINDSGHNYSTILNDSKEINNATYEVPSTQNRQLYSVDELDSVKNLSASESSVHRIPDIIDVKTVLKDNLNDSCDTSISSVDSKGSYEDHKPTPHSQSLHDFSKTSLKEITKSPEKSLNRLKVEGTNKFETDDTYEGTSSIAEDSIVSNNKDVPLIDFDKTSKIISPVASLPLGPIKSLIDQTLDESLPNKSSRVLLSPEGICSDKKKPDKTEKPKPMSGLSSLTDLPPLQITKARSPDTVLLPSLYSKEFRERSNLKEIDKLLDISFDSIDNYEEDFILSGNMDYERNKNISSILLKNDHNKITDSTKHFKSGKLYDNENRSQSKNLDMKDHEDKSILTSIIDRVNNSEELSISHRKNIDNGKRDMGSSSISEELDFNLNTDELLKSHNANQ